MLKLLHIENIAIIERCDIAFGAGFNVLTGETGAGKSIIIDSISAILGERTSRELVRTGAPRAVVSAVFDSAHASLQAWLDEQGFEREEEIFVQREITSDGKSTCRLNGRPVPVGQLREFGALLINIHGQHDSHALLNSTRHAEFIDRFAATREYTGVIGRYRSEYERFRALAAEQKMLMIDENEAARRTEMLQYEIDELTQAELAEGELEALAERRVMLRNASRITEELSRVAALFSGNEESAGILADLGGVERAMYALPDELPGAAELAARAAELAGAGADLAAGVSDLLEQIDASPEEIDRVETRYDQLRRLCAKYHADEAGLIALLEQKKTELSQIVHADERRAQVEEELDACEDACWALAQTLFDLRRAAAREFETRVLRELADLDMGKVRFHAAIKPREHLNERGADEMEFLIATNLGEPLKPLAKIASGGEMARIMLALKNVLAESDEVETLVFDEVDSGISGRAALRVAEKLAALSGKKQVLCVTHLPQMSAMADTHFKIEKSEHDGKTRTDVSILDEDGRIDELARMIGGQTITETTRSGARELIESARNTKRELRKNDII